MQPTAPIVLVVDDEPLIRLNAVAFLEDAGYATLEAADADEALRVFSANPGVRLLFTDVHMPGALDGIALAREIHARKPDVAIIVTSGRALPDRGEIPDRGVFLPKPYSADDFVSRIDRMLRAA